MASSALRRRWRSMIGAALVLPLLPIPASAWVARQGVVAAQVAPRPAKADEFLVVESWLTAQRVIWTSQGDCPIDERAELWRLRQALSESRARERAAATGQLDLERALAEREARFLALERALTERSRADADRQRAETEREAAEVARLRKELEDSRSKERMATAGLRDIERAVAEREAQLEAKEREIADLRAAVHRTEPDEHEEAGLRASPAKLEAESSPRRAARRPALPPQGEAQEAPPLIELIEPELGSTRGSGVQPASSVVVVGRVRSAGGLKSLSVNGREETVDLQGLFNTQVAVRNAEERIRIVAVDRTGRKSALEFALGDPGSARGVGGGEEGVRIGLAKTGKLSGFGNYHALVIGIDEYRLMRPLRTAAHDAREIARVLEREYGFKTTLLVNASRYDVLSALHTLRERLTEKDNLLIYYAGHGQLDQLNQRGYWLPVDAEPESPTNWISSIAITDVLNAMTARQLLVVSDSCYSGALTRSAIARLEPGMSEQQLAQVLMSMAQKRSRMVLTSGGLEPVLDGGGGAHSLFARTFLDLLRANRGLLPGQEMFRHLRLRVAAEAERAQISQVPEYAPIKHAGHEAGDFIFVRATD